jgi:hypothetical protein
LYVFTESRLGYEGVVAPAIVAQLDPESVVPLPAVADAAAVAARAAATALQAVPVHSCPVHVQRGIIVDAAALQSLIELLP